ncbi:glycoside hydrolase family 2 protein [Seonamhaeicola marinus]|uniref:beta-galactosidase n=1 Tax=Seonamhaeicola marinus TaxID=1912246 RepID=A0A5D0I660_9FLAO|nr:glycoside hydrolase family 2 TIM barrel-domain containing protein [Seonamhaeicola marinus]TYA78361.1 beta-galactosidase [Seonamhaeicola marinus]
MRISKLILLTLIVLSHQLIEAQKETEVVYLSGTDKDNLVEWDFFCSEGRNSGKWTKIGVPSCWEQKGFGTYNYGSGMGIVDMASEHGLYKYKFNVPKTWKNKNVRIVFEGVMTDAQVKINAKLAGPIHQGAFYEFKYDITKLLKFGTENVLEVKVNKMSANESINHAERGADFWVFGGIYRPVYLSVSPKDNINRIAVDARADGQITTDVFIESKKANTVSLSLFDLRGNKVQDIKVNVKKEQEKWRVSGKADGIKTWNPEFPNLYKLQISLLDKNENILHKVEERIGFRTVEVLKGDGIYVNGERIKFKGVNRHAFHPASGRTTSKKISIEHVQLMKDMNMNAVRMSHYPPDVHFLDVCDSLGLFVLDEICTWHNPMLDTKVARKIVKETVVRDVNHPSILMWGNGNEQGWNPEVDNDFTKWDIQKREVIHPWSIYKKTNTIHYSHYHSLVNDSYSREKILFPTEFLHGVYDGGHGAGLEDYWLRMWNLPLSAGGFLWDFADEGVERTDRNNEIDLQGNKANDGIVGPYLEKEASYFAIKEIWSPIYLEDRFINEDFNGIFRIENRYHYTNLDQITMTSKWITFEGPEGNTSQKVLSEYKVDLPSLNPGGKGKFYVQKPSHWKSADALHLIAVDAYGREIFTWSYPVSSPSKVSEPLVLYSGGGTIKTTTEDQKITIKASDLTYQFSQETGLLLEVKKGNQIIPLNNGPIILNQKAKIEDIKISSLDDKIEILTIFEKTNKSPGWSTVKEYASDIIKWTVHSNGLLDLRVEFKGYRNLKGYRGITFSFPENEVAGMKWLGDGPYRVWRNRMKGTRFQVWENDYNNTVTGEVGKDQFVYPEFKGFFSSLYWSKVKGNHDNGFTVYCRTPHTYFRMLTPQEPKQNKKGKTHPKFPEGDISFVMNVPGIGTKFQKPESMGPQGNSEHYFGNDDEPIVMDLTFEF